MKKYGYNLYATHQAIIFELGTQAADAMKPHADDTPGLIVGSSEWGWIKEDSARRICAALTFFSDTDTEEIERLACNFNEKIDRIKGRDIAVNAEPIHPNPKS